MPGEFYHATAIHEPTTKAALKDLCQLFEHDLRALGAVTARDSTATFHFEQGSVVDITPQVNGFSLRVLCFEREGIGWEGKISVRSLLVDVLFGSSYRTDPEAIVTAISLPKGEAINLGSSPRFGLAPQTLKAFESYRRSIEGFPSGGMAHVMRMSYFSAVTIATVGYGDITPLTDRARLLSGLESTLGVVFVGLFLNALGKRIEQAYSGKPIAPR
ncbi:MAG: hypothetical protein QOE26_881 [Verrucomicrobiota bacterium]